MSPDQPDPDPVTPADPLGAPQPVVLPPETLPVNDTVGPLAIGLGKVNKDATMRSHLAIGLLLILAILTFGTGAYVVTNPAEEPAIESFMKLVFTPIVGLVGSVIGFYFGANAAQQAPAQQ